MSYYPFDPFGIADGNIVHNELLQITAINGIDHNYIIFTNSPIITKDFALVDRANGKILERYVDFDFCFGFDYLKEGEQGISVDAFGGIYFKNKNITGVFVSRYRTLGGPFVTAETRLLQDGLIAYENAIALSWDNIDLSTIPETYPIGPHTNPIESIQAVTEIIDAANALTVALSQSPPYIKTSDIIDLDSSFLSPIISATDRIADAIREKNKKSVFHEKFTPSISELTMLDMQASQWHDIDLQGTVTHDGTWQITSSVSAVSGDGDSRLNPFKRVLISADSGVTFDAIPESYIDGAIIGLGVGWMLKVQIMSLKEILGVTLHDPDGPCGHGLQIVRLGD